MADKIPDINTDEHSRLVGGSTAGRRIACPASYQQEQLLPPEAFEEESSYAAEGTALHECMEYIMTNDIIDLEDVVGLTFYEHTMTQDLVAECIVPCVEFLDTLFDEDEDMEFMLEVKCPMPGIPGAFGKADFVGRLPNRTVVVDYKFGGGVPVYASYPVTDIEVAEGEPVARRGNPQGMFYGRSALEKVPELFGEGDDWPVELIFLQPRMADREEHGGVSRFMTTVGELEAFRLLLIEKIDEAVNSDNPHMERGEHCRWAPCKTRCAKFTGPLLDLTQKVKDDALNMDKTDLMPEEEYAQLLADLMNFGDIVEDLIKEAQKQAFIYLEDGQEIPGWVLRAKRAGHDKWNPDKSFKQIDGYLGRQGLELDERRKVDHITPAQARDKLKALGKELDYDRYVAKGKSSGYTLGRAENTENPITRTNMVAFAKRIASLSG